MKRLLIDAGNTNVKFAVTDGADFIESGVLPTAGELVVPRSGVGEVWVSNVAGDAVRRKILALCGALPVHFIEAQPMQCGVVNGYEEPSRLGPDRWAALIYAWHLLGRACLVVNSGTATTIDALSDRGQFLGGLILPGVALMRRSLDSAAANLHEAAGGYADFPRNTQDAMQSGAIQASCGAIAQQYLRLNDAGAQIMLGGGAAPLLVQHLNLPVRIVDNPVLHGLLLIANEAGGA